MPATAEEVFDRVERDVLDRAHQRLNLLFRNQGDAITAVLRCYAQVLRDLRTGRIAKPNDVAKAQTVNEGLRGLGHCLRWIAKCCPSKLLVPAPRPDRAAREAVETLRWGVAYDPIWNQHSAHRGGLVEFKVDEPAKLITFQPMANVDPRFFCSQIEAKKADDQRREQELPEKRLAQLSKKWFDSSTFSNQGLRFDDAMIGRCGAIDVASEWMGRTCLPELPATINLLGYTVADVRRVLASLYVYSLFVTKLEDVADDQPASRGIFDSCVISRPKNAMVDWLANLSGVTKENVDAIISVLTFDPDHPHVTLAQQPFISSSEGHIFLLPRMLRHLDLPRMYVSAINKPQEGRKIYERLIENIEEVGVQEMVRELRDKGLSKSRIVLSKSRIVEKKTFHLPSGAKITPDIVVLTESHEALVIDVKYATPPFGPLDIRRDIHEFDKWKKRMAEYVAAFETPNVIGQHFAGAPKTCISVNGLILLRWPFPVPVEFDGMICAIDWPSLKRHIGERPNTSIRELMAWAHSRPDCTVPETLNWTEKNVRAGEWTYRYSVLISALET